MNTRQVSIAFSGALFALAAALSPAAGAACHECGTVTSVETVTKEGEGSGLGMVLGGVAGGVLGHQVGSGRGNTAATVAGAVGGAVVGNEVEKRHGRGDYYRVIVRYPDGREETYTQDEIGDLHVGDRVHREAGRLYRD